MNRQVSALVFVLLISCAAAQRDTSVLRRPPDTTASFEFPLYSVNVQGDEQNEDQQDISALLQSSKDPFARFAAFQWSAARFRLRGLPSFMHTVFLNGADISNEETGSADWSAWGGINEILRNADSRFGQGPASAGYIQAGGYTDLDLRASSFRKNTKASYSFSNRIFRHRIMFTHATGLNKRGWATVFSLAARHGEEVYMPGTYFRAYSAFFSIDKRINRNRTMSFSCFAAPLSQGVQSAATLEAYSLAGAQLYNPAWGFQNGKVRNSKVNTAFRPTALLTHNYNSQGRVRITNTLFYQGGVSGVTGLWSTDAPNARPDYYKYMPSYFFANNDSAAGREITNSWLTNENMRQINWDRLINLNRTNFYSTDLSTGVNTTETLARYVLERKETRQNMAGMSNTVSWSGKKMRYSAGLLLKYSGYRHYKVAEDLLGATFLLDTDPFADPQQPQTALNDIDNAGRRVRQGEKFGYDYSLERNEAKIWAQAERTWRAVDLYVTTGLETSRSWRTGHVANGKFPQLSKGRSESVQLSALSARCGGTWKLSGRQYVRLNLSVGAFIPQLPALFLSPETRNQLTYGLSTEKEKAADISYHLLLPGLGLRFTAYQVNTDKGMWLRRLWDDELGTTINMLLTNVSRSYSGLEAGLQKSWGSHRVEVACSAGNAVYRNRPGLFVWNDNDQSLLIEERTVYIRNYMVNSAPQTAAGVSYVFSGRGYWHLGLALNYFCRQFVEINPNRRTAQAIANLTSSDAFVLRRVLTQQELPAYTLMNFTAGKSFRVKRAFISSNLTITNLLDRLFATASAYEQLRWSQTTASFFSPRYSFVQGRSYMLVLTLSI